MAFEDDENGPEDIRKVEKRKTFQRNLEEQGLELELEPSHVSLTHTECDNIKVLLLLRCYVKSNLAILGTQKVAFKLF